jgi:hypothetical protein
MSYQVEYDDQDLHYRCVVIRIENRHRCGYVSVPEGHPFHGKEASDKVPCDLDNVLVNPSDPIGTVLALGSDAESGVALGYLANVHGGITYTTHLRGDEPITYPVTGASWWFGFDADHHRDDFDGGRSLAFMVKECKRLRDFLQSHEKGTQ